MSEEAEPSGLPHDQWRPGYAWGKYASLVEQLTQAKAENERLATKLTRIQSMAGNPDPAEACRLIIVEAGKELADG